MRTEMMEMVQQLDESTIYWIGQGFRGFFIFAWCFLIFETWTIIYKATTGNTLSYDLCLEDENKNRVKPHEYWGRKRLPYNVTNINESKINRRHHVRNGKKKS